MARPFKICPDCGAHLDASEPCDCKDAIEREPPKPWERLKLLAVCREVDKESGRVSVYPLDLEITSEILASLKMRAQFNPELRYFTTTTARWDRYGEVMAGIIKLLDSIKGYEMESRRLRLEERKYNLAKQKLSGAFDVDPETGEIIDEVDDPCGDPEI